MRVLVTILLTITFIFPTLAWAKMDCKVTQEKDKAGNIIYKLTGEDCKKVAENVNAQRERINCGCSMSGNIFICKGGGCSVPYMKSQAPFLDVRSGR